MSLQQTAFLHRPAIPTQPLLQAAVDALSVDCRISKDFSSGFKGGFLPCTLNGKPSGFEVLFIAASEVLADCPHIAPVVGARDVALCFRWGGDFSELACVIAVSAALANSFDAVIYYEEDDLVYSRDELLADLQEALELAKTQPGI